MVDLQHATLRHLLQEDPGGPSRWARDGGYGGCGGFEVFAFLAFLIALLDLLLDLNDMDDMMGTGGRRLTRAAAAAAAPRPLAEGGPQDCSDKLDLNEGVWAAGQLAMGVLQAVTSPPACGHAHLCRAAAATARRGPLPATLVRLAGAWLDSWPGLSGSELGQVALQAASSLTCHQYPHNNCSHDVTQQHLTSPPLQAQLSSPQAQVSPHEAQLWPQQAQPVLTSPTVNPWLVQAQEAIAQQLYNFKKKRQT